MADLDDDAAKMAIANAEKALSAIRESCELDAKVAASNEIGPFLHVHPYLRKFFVDSVHATANIACLNRLIYHCVYLAHYRCAPPPAESINAPTCVILLERLGSDQYFREQSRHVGKLDPSVENADNLRFCLAFTGFRETERHFYYEAPPLAPEQAYEQRLAKLSDASWKEIYKTYESAAIGILRTTPGFCSEIATRLRSNKRPNLVRALKEILKGCPTALTVFVHKDTEENMQQLFVRLRQENGDKLCFLTDPKISEIFPEQHDDMAQLPEMSQELRAYLFAQQPLQTGLIATPASTHTNRLPLSEELAAEFGSYNLELRRAINAHQYRRRIETYLREIFDNVRFPYKLFNAMQDCGIVDEINRIFEGGGEDEESKILVRAYLYRIIYCDIYGATPKYSTKDNIPTHMIVEALRRIDLSHYRLSLNYSCDSHELMVNVATGIHFNDKLQPALPMKEEAVRQLADKMKAGENFEQMHLEKMAYITECAKALEDKSMQEIFNSEDFPTWNHIFAEIKDPYARFNEIYGHDIRKTIEMIAENNPEETANIKGLLYFRIMQLMTFLDLDGVRHNLLKRYELGIAEDTSLAMVINVCFRNWMMFGQKKRQAREASFSYQEMRLRGCFKPLSVSDPAAPATEDASSSA